MHQTRRALPLFAVLLAACGGGGGAPDTNTADDLQARTRLVMVGSLAPQSFVHASVSSTLQLGWSFNGTAGDLVAPDVWPEAAAHAPVSDLIPTLTLLGPKVSGHRPVIAEGLPRDVDPRHLAIDNLRLPTTGQYLLVVGAAPGSPAGSFTLRLWTSASHLPRPEAAQLDLALSPSAAQSQMVSDHAAGGRLGQTPWTDAEVEGLLRAQRQQSDLRVAFSDAAQLVTCLQQAATDGRATTAQAARARQNAAALVGDAGAFSALTDLQQAFALQWLGVVTGSVFEVTDVPLDALTPTLSAVQARVDGLVASWPGARLAPAGLRLQRFTLGGAVVGHLAIWTAEQPDLDGNAVFAWTSFDWFDGQGCWLGEQSAGASEPDDDER